MYLFIRIRCKIQYNCNLRLVQNVIFHTVEVNYTYVFTGCSSLNNTLRFFENYVSIYGKIFQTKVV